MDRMIDQETNEDIRLSIIRFSISRVTDKDIRIRPGCKKLYQIDVENK